MHKLYFRYGTMNSSKTANLMMVAHNYRFQNKRIILAKPSVDDRGGITKISSRALGSVEADINIYPYKTNNFKQTISESKEEIHCILVDEAQFLSESNVEELRKLTNQIPVICYGLRTDYRSLLFPGSKRLLELADTIEEIKTICVQCKNKAIINCKFSIENDRQIFIKSGSGKPDIGAEEKYKPLCWKCWY